MSLLLKVSLLGTSKPPVWRKILLNKNESFETLHYAIQSSFGWHNAHLWEFSPQAHRGLRIGPAFDDNPFMEAMGEDMQDASKVPISTIFAKPNDHYIYVYDMGDNWEHKIVLEEILEEPAPNPICTAGKGSCPPEDCGGIPGYYMMVEAINNPDHPEHEDMLDWVELDEGDKWDMDLFDLEDTQAYMKNIFA